MAAWRTDRLYLVLAIMYGITMLSDGFIFDDPCHFLSLATPNNNNSQIVNLDLTCENGKVDWHYPRGSLHLHYKKTSKYGFDFCIVESWATSFGGITDLTDGHNTKLPVPTKDDPTCVSSVNDEATFSLSAGSEQHYLTAIDFNIIFHTATKGR